jgi:DNA polymerase I
MYLDYDKNKTYICDIEADSLSPTLVWCMCWEFLGDGSTGDCIGHDQIKEFFDERHDCVFVFHNGIGYDAYHLSRLLGIRLSPKNVIDTYILSVLYSPSLAKPEDYDGDKGAHSLDCWGHVLGFPKGSHDDFSRFSPEMLHYCRQDVKITGILFRRLIKTLIRIGFSETSIWIQHRIMEILGRQQRNGFYFDGQRAIDLYNLLRAREEELQDEIREAFPSQPVTIRVGPVFTKDGRERAIYVKDSERFRIRLYPESGTYEAIEDVEFSIGSPKQRVEKLLELGWKPEEFTPRTKSGGGGNPKPFEHGELSPSLERFMEEKEIPEVRLIAKWMAINGRANMINTWLNEWNHNDGCIHGKLFVADTLRFRHQAPNTANIPAVRVSKQGDVLYGDTGYWTYEARDLWCARPGRVLVGTDAAGLELRMLAHYLNRPEFTDQVVNGDPHQYNADVAGVTRPKAKTLLYAIQYGAQGPKVGKIMGVSSHEGGVVRQQFLDRLGLTDVMNEAQREQQNGRIKLLDGSMVVCPSPHAALNYRLQGGGARVMSLASIIFEGHIRRHGLDSIKVGDIHDEWQYDVHEDCASEHGRLAVQSIREAGEKLRLNVPLDGTSKKGLTWAETH